MRLDLEWFLSELYHEALFLSPSGNALVDVGGCRPESHVS
jgi:hypothetical protein